MYIYIYIYICIYIYIYIYVYVYVYVYVYRMRDLLIVILVKLSWDQVMYSLAVVCVVKRDVVCERSVGRLENEYSLKNKNDFGPYARPCVYNKSILGISELRKELELSVLNYREYKMNNFVRNTTAELTCTQIEDVCINVVEMYFWGRSVPICCIFNSISQIFKSL